MSERAKPRPNCTEQVDVGTIELGRVGRRVVEGFKVIIPASVLFIMSDLRLGIGQAVIGMILAQMVLGIAGMGFMLTNYGNQFATDYLVVVVLSLPALGILLTEIVKFAERSFIHWRPDDHVKA